MSPERWQQIERLYDAVIQHQPGERAALLEQWCAGDDELRREVEWMLAHQQEAAHFIQVPALEAAARSLASDSDESPAESASEPRATNRGRPRWWMYVVTASFLPLHGFFFYLVFKGPIYLPGLDVRFEDGALQVRTVTAGTELARAGLRTGDRVLTVSGMPVRDANDWRVVMANLHAGRPQSWEVFRSPNRVEVIITPERRRWGLTNVSYGGLYLLLFSLGVLISFRRPDDPIARIGGWFFMTVSVVFGVSNGWAVAWREVIPIPVHVILCISEISRFVVDGIFLSFFAMFPRRLFRARWPWFLIWVPVLATLPWRAWGFYSTIYRPGLSTGVPGWIDQAINLRTMLFLVAAVAMLVISYRRLTDLNERRRVRVLMTGTAIGLVAAAIPTAWAYSFGGYGIEVNYLLYGIALIPLLLACPFSFAYAILRHRILDIHIIIRQGLQYALARRAVLGVVPAVGAILISDLIINSAQPLASILRARGWAYGGLSGLVIVTYRKRKQWLDALDRRFFRERYDAQRTLRDVAAEIGQSRSVERAAPRVVARIKTALHPEFISMMVREPDGTNYRSLASVPSGHVLPAIQADSKLITLMTVLGKPLEVSPEHSAWLARPVARRRNRVCTQRAARSACSHHDS